MIQKSQFCAYLSKTVIQKDTHTSLCIATLFTVVMTWKQSKCPMTDKWIKKKKDVVFIHNGIPLSHKKNEIMPFGYS